MVTLEIPPYRFKRKTDAKEIGKRAYFECNSCEKLDEKTSAHAIKHEDENGEIFYELVPILIELCQNGLKNMLLWVDLKLKRMLWVFPSMLVLNQSKFQKRM